LKYLMSFLALWVEDSNSLMRIPELLGSYLIRFRDEDVPGSFKGQSTDVILKIFEDFLALREELPFPDDSAFEEFVKNNSPAADSSTAAAATAAATTAAVSDGRIPVTCLDKEDIAQLMHSVENSHLVLDLNDIAPSSTTPATTSHKHTPSTCSVDSEGETTRGRTNSGGSNTRQPQEPFDDDSADRDLSAEGSVDSPRRDSKHTSTRARASQLFKKFKQSISSKKRVHMSVGNTPASSVHPGTPEDDSNSSGCNTPTGTYTPSAPIAVPQANQHQDSLDARNDDSPGSPHKTDDAQTDDAQTPESK